MNPKLIEIKIESAKSWFAFAQIMIILAGFLFTSSGIAWNHSEEIIKLSKDISYFQLERMDQITLTNEINVSQYDSYFKITNNLILDNLDKNNERLNSCIWLLNIYFGGGFFCVLLSICFWIKGKKELEKLDH